MGVTANSKVLDRVIRNPTVVTGMTQQTVSTRSFLEKKPMNASIQIPQSRCARWFRALFIGLCLMTLASPATSGAESPVQPVLIFVQPEDVFDRVGMLTFEANPLAFRAHITPVRSDSAATPSAGRDANAGIPFRPLLAVPQPDGGCLVFGSDSQETKEQPKTYRWRLYRARTPDGYRFADLKEVYRNPKGPWLIEAAMVRQASTGQVYFYPWGRSAQPERGHALWGFASDDGEKWRPLSDQPLYLDHDAFGMMWDGRTSRFLTGQVTHQRWEKPYADNMGATKRRVLTMRTSQDGVRWETVGNAGNGGLITPDDKDAPDVEFYRLQPFAYGDRYIAMADLYAGSPLTPNQHGPHLTCEWWVSADGINWQRPWRTVDAQADAPYPIKMAPMWFGREMLFWLAGQVYGLPEYRLASIGSRSNAGFSTAAFVMPEKPLRLNASVPAGQGLFRQAYVQVELRNESNQVIPGYERDQCLLLGIDDTRIPLRWGDKAGKELAGQKVSLRFHLRSARIYAVVVER